MCWEWFSIVTLWIIPSKAAHSEASVAWWRCCQNAYMCVGKLFLYVCSEYCANCAKARRVHCGGNERQQGPKKLQELLIHLCACACLCLQDSQKTINRCHVLIWLNCWFAGRACVWVCYPASKGREYKRWMSDFDVKLPTVKLQLQ